MTTKNTLLSSVLLWFLGSVATAAVTCNITSSACANGGTAFCNAAGYAPTVDANGTFWSTGSCGKTPYAIRCVEMLWVKDKNGGNIRLRETRPTFGCCDKQGNTYVTPLEADAKQNCDHP